MNLLRETIFTVVSFGTLYKLAVTFETEDEILKCKLQVRVTEHCFPAVMFFML